MIGIIQDWLFSQLGIYFNLDKLEENNIFQDGTVFVDILSKYGLLNSNYSVNITKAVDQELCKKNLKLLKPIFDMLCVKYDDKIVLDIIKSNTSTILKLLYELYVCLENKQLLYFITQQNFETIQKNRIKCLNNDDIFVSNVEFDKNIQDEDACLKMPLITNKDLVEWYKKRYKIVEESMNSRLRKLKENLCEKKIEMVYPNIKQRKKCPCSCKTGLFNQELVASLPDLDMFYKSSSNENLLSYDKFIASFKAKNRRRSIKQGFENEIQNDLLQETWNKIMEKQNEIYNSIFAEIMIKQSHYEKQILTKLIQTQNQIKIENENLIRSTNKIIEEEDNKINSDFKMKEEFEQLENMYETERSRVSELHKKLYKQKQDLIKKKHYNMCRDVMDSLVDMAISASEYQSKYGVAVPKVLWQSWKQYFYKELPVHTPFETLEREILPEEIIIYDDIIDYEKRCSAIVNENDVDEYLYTCGRWFYEDICKEYGGINESALAFIVYRLLSLKYPPPASPLPAQIPPFRVAGILLDFYSTECIAKLKTLLSKPQIHIFDLDTAVKLCISAFERETFVEKPKKSVTGKKSLKTPKKEKKRKGSSKTSSKKGKKEKLEKKSANKKSKKDKTKKSSGLVSDEVEVINLNDKETQTSIIAEEDNKKVERTTLGLIGEQVFNILKEGNKLEDSLLMTVIIEYLKTLNDYDGWVLLNYPNTINQASIMELALSGKRLPLENYVSGDDEFVEEEIPDENAEKRKSRILECPTNKSDKSSFKTYFTVFIKIKQNDTEKSQHLNDVENKLDQISKQNEERGSQINIKDKDSEIILPDILEAFYKDQSIYQDLNFKVCDLVFLKQLARTILLENGIEKTDSVELFGKEALDKLSKSNKKGKKEKSDKSKKVKESKKNKKIKGKKESTKPEKTELKDDIGVVETEEPFLEGEEVKPPAEESLVVKTLGPDDEQWQSVSLPLTEEIAIVLATIWENIESCYLQNLKDVCFENRFINLRLVPYSTYLKETIEEVAKKKDLRQDLVDMFQNYYKGFDEDLRLLPEVKNHLFCKVLEMQQNLWEIVDDKKNEIESKRQDLIYENWMVYEICMLINNYLSLVQTEFDRSVTTYRLVSDYYLNMLEKPLLASQLINSKVTKLTANELIIGPNSGLTNTIDTENTSPKQRNTSTESDGSNFIAKHLLSCHEKERVIDNITYYLSREVQLISDRFQAISHTFLSQIKAESDLLIAASKKKAKEKSVVVKGKKTDEKGSDKSKKKKSVQSKGKADNNSEKVKKKESSKSSGNEPTQEPEGQGKESLLTEWKFVVDTETERFKFRMDLISARAKEDILEFYCFLESVFCDVFSSNLSQYETDIDNINKLCDYLRTAIEEESSLIYPITLKRGEFSLDISQNLIGEDDNAEIKELLEKTHNCHFTINQLKKLMFIFKIAGPHGVIRKQPFCYILQDLALFNNENNEPHLPKMWKTLSDTQLSCAIDGIFGSEYAINWRDFIIYNLDIPYPSFDDILSLRKDFLSHDLENTEIVLSETYDSIKLWFEKDLPSDPQEGLRFALIKGLLSEMFQVDNLRINYTALLLYFCKDHDPRIGFKKALCLSIGKNVIISEEELDEILKDEAEIKASVENLLENIINSIVQNKEGVLIYEVFESMSDLNINNTDSSYTVSEKSNSASGSIDNEQKFNESDGFENDFQSDNESLKRTLLPEDDFLNSNKVWVSKVPIDTVISILNASFLHQDKTFSLRNQYLRCLEEESDEDGMILAHVLMSSDCMKTLFSLTNKFRISLPCEILVQCSKMDSFSY